MNQYWSWILTAVGLTGFVLAGRKVWWCWYINIGCQALWMTYAIVTEQWGFIVASLAYTFVFTKNAIKWTREHRNEHVNVNQPIGRITAAGEDEHGVYMQGYIDADVAATLGIYEGLRGVSAANRGDDAIKIALNLVEKRIKDGTATAEEVTHFLRLGGMNSRE